MYSIFHRAPSDCRQYFTGASGTFKSYNFGGGLMLAGQMYTYCFRQELGKKSLYYRNSASHDEGNLNNFDLT